MVWFHLNSFLAINFWPLAKSYELKGGAGKTVWTLISCTFLSADMVSAFKAQTPNLLTVDHNHTVDVPTLISVKIVLTYIRKETIRSNVRKRRNC